MTVATQADNDLDGLVRWFASTSGERVDIELVRYSTAGARRRNVIVDVVTLGSRQRVVATIQPTASIELMSVGTEAAVRTLAGEHGVPVPKVLGWSDDPSFVGGPFYVSEFIDGETIPKKVLRFVDEMALGDRIVDQLGKGLARLHTVSASAAPSELPRNDPIASALDGVERGIADLLQPEPAFTYGLRWLREHAPAEPAASVLVHADVRTGNIIIGQHGLHAILDWETAKIGDPMEDLAWTCTRMWRFGRDDLEVGGLGTVDALRGSYVGAGCTWDDDRFGWWRVLTSLRWGLGLAGQAAAHLDGSFRSIVMAASGRRVAEMLYDALCLIGEQRRPLGSRPDGATF